MADITLFSSGVQLPTHLRRGELSSMTRALMGTSNKRISIEGGVFRMIVGGQEVAVNEDRAMNVIFVRVAEHNSRQYYAGVFQKGVKVVPTCWSSDAKVPHESVKTPQNRTCTGCPQDIKGSGQGDIRACRYSRRAAVLLESDSQGDIYALNVPAASLFDNGEGRKMGLQQYARFLGGHGVDVNAVVTEMRFDTNSTAPKLTFSAVRPLTEEEWETVKRRHDDEASIKATTMTVGELDGATEASKSIVEELKPSRLASTPVVNKPTGTGGFAVSKSLPPPTGAIAEPVVRETAKATAPNVTSILNEWADADD